MTVQISQIPSPEPNLFGDYSVKNHLDHTFQQYLEEEQKRIGLLFSPFSQFNFSSLFEYSDSSSKKESKNSSIDYLSRLIAAKPFENSPSKTQEPAVQSLLNASQSNPLFQSNSGNLSPQQLMVQELLNQTGWLTPNLEALPLFYQAQIKGSMLDKLDLQFLVDQILSQVKLVKEKGKVELIVGLKPQDLGEILLTLTSRSGMISIQIQAKESAKKLIEADLLELKLALKKAKINLSEIKIETLKEAEQHA